MRFANEEVRRQLRRSRSLTQPAIFQGHTRFATSSIAGFDGCHPHQFSPPREAEVWRHDPATKATFRPATRNLEAYITRNGDLDFFQLHGVVVPLSGLQALLPALLHSPLPSSVDSVCERKAATPQRRVDRMCLVLCSAPATATATATAMATATRPERPRGGCAAPQVRKSDTWFRHTASTHGFEKGWSQAKAVTVARPPPRAATNRDLLTSSNGVFSNPCA